MVILVLVIFVIGEGMSKDTPRGGASTPIINIVILIFFIVPDPDWGCIKRKKYPADNRWGKSQSVSWRTQIFIKLRNCLNFIILFCLGVFLFSKMCRPDSLDKIWVEGVIMGRNLAFHSGFYPYLIPNGMENQNLNSFLVFYKDFNSTQLDLLYYG